MLLRRFRNHASRCRPPAAISHTDRVQVHFRGMFFIIFRHPNFCPPGNNITTALIGYSMATLASSLGCRGSNGGLNPL